MVEFPINIRTKQREDLSKQPLLSPLQKSVPQLLKIQKTDKMSVLRAGCQLCIGVKNPLLPFFSHLPLSQQRCLPNNTVPQLLVIGRWFERKQYNQGRDQLVLNNVQDRLAQHWYTLHALQSLQSTVPTLQCNSMFTGTPRNVSTCVLPVSTVFYFLYCCFDL